MSSFFTIIHPVIPLDFNRLLDFINASYVLGMTTASSNGNASYNLLIKGLKLSVNIFYMIINFRCKQSDALTLI